MVELIDSAVLLKSMDYDFLVFAESAVKPLTVAERFSDILPGLGRSKSSRGRSLSERPLYVHQSLALADLSSGLNLVLKAGTGSGKTEAWFLYAAKNRVRTLAVYPTLALANDQHQRLSDYCNELGMTLVSIDAARKQEHLKNMGARELRRKITEADIVVTNPAFLMNELKRIAFGKASLLRDFLARCGLVVLDEFDFYGPRSTSILLAMMRVVVEIINPSIQITIMTATLQDPHEVAEILTAINGRRTAVVDGQAFHPENRTYLVLGKSLEGLWTRVRAQAELLKSAGAGYDVIKSLEDFELFRINFFKIVEAAEAGGIDVKGFFDDPAEVLSRYASDDALTLVFTNSIAAAEEMARRVSTRLGGSEAVATHHHLLLKTQRQEIEEKARSGVVKIIFTPRTLSQGIDIGEARRVVHLGLPKNVREFRQREGRKGRRPEVEWTETVVIPYSSWDRHLLSKGVDVFKKWLDLPLEKSVVNRDNLYGYLFKALFSFQSPLMRSRMKKDEVLFLRSLGLERDGALTTLGKYAWLKMNFYEFAPPYGVKRWRVRDDGGLRNLEDISHVDLVEKFQPGAIDPSSDGVVVEAKLGGSRGRVVTAVVVDDLRESRLRRVDTLAPVLEEYERTKLRWGETPDLRRDYRTGRLQSLIHLVAHVPSNGFGYFTEFPNRVEWRIASEKRQFLTFGERTLVSRVYKTVEVPTPTYGVYGDYTYGLSVEASPHDEQALLRVGACFLVIVFRRVYNISLDLLKYDIHVVGERKVVSFYEAESACLLPKVNWREVYEKVSTYMPDVLDEVLMEQVDEQAYASFVSLKLDWEAARRHALKILEYVMLTETLQVQLGPRVVEVVKPSKALKAVSFSAIAVGLRDDLGAGLYSTALFDGDETRVFTGMTEFNQPDEEHNEALSRLLNLINQGFKVLVYDLTSVLKTLENAGLHAARALLAGLNEGGKVVDVKQELVKRMGKEIPLETLETSLNLKTAKLVDIAVSRELVKRGRPAMRLIRSKPEKLREVMEKTMAEEARSIFIAWLVCGKI
ncbi:MAG: DEAD/DEAH box helicase [Candidatus Caldarchaeum sp.]